MVLQAALRDVEQEDQPSIRRTARQISSHAKYLDGAKRHYKMMIVFFMQPDGPVGDRRLRGPTKPSRRPGARRASWSCGPSADQDARTVRSRPAHRLAECPGAVRS